MRIDLPLEVLSHMAPLLSWVEGPAGINLPDAWIAASADLDRRQGEWLRHELPNYSCDTVDEIRELSRQPGSSARRPPRPWRHGRRLEPPAGWDLTDSFDRLTDRYFVWSEGSAAVRERRMEELHELSLRFPVGHLIRHFHARSVGRGRLSEARAAEQPEQLGLLPSNSYGLRTVVRRGLSEGHLHLHGVTSAEESWADAMLKEFSVDALQGYGPIEKRLLLLSRYCGHLLALTVLAIELDGPALPLPGAVLPHLDALYFAEQPYLDLVVRRRLKDALRRPLVDREFGRMAADRLDRWEGDGLEWLLFWIGRTAWWLRRAATEPTEPPRTALGRGRMLSRLHLRAHCLLQRLDDGSPARHLLQQVLFRYLVLRTHHWQLATQSGKTTGLRHFKSFYDSRFRRPGRSHRETQKIILDRLRHWRGLRVVEGRISPPDRGAADLVPWITGYAEGAEAKRLSKFGLVVHFIKAESEESRARRHHGFEEVRLGRIRRVSRSQAFRLYRLLADAGPWVPFIVGIDAANLELTTPPEVYGPVFRFLREFPVEPRDVPDINSDRFKVLPSVRELAAHRRLGMTYHVGEDFRHLLSGLRAIWEAVDFLHAQPGDRLGHATALGLEPAVWAEQSGYQAVVPRLEWLDTLVWVVQLVGAGDEVVMRLALEDKIQRLAWQVYAGREPGGDRGASQDLSLLTLHDARRLRQLDPYCVDATELGHGSLRFRERPVESPEWWRWCDVQSRVHRSLRATTGSPHAYRLLRRYWFDGGVRVRGDRLEVVDMQDDWRDWRRLCEAAQERTLAEVRRRELVVEVNPSVNRVIGPMASLNQHPVFRLSLGDDRRLRRDVRITVNTDNPAVFNTSLAHEFYLLGEVLMREGRPESEVVEWLDWLRENGINYSFVRQLPDHGERHMRDLLAAVRRPRPRVRDLVGRSAKRAHFWEGQEHAFLRANPEARPEPGSAGGRGK